MFKLYWEFKENGKYEMFIGRLQGMSKEFVEEKKKHKEICTMASKCTHEMMCSRTCYFTDKSYIESEDEESEDEIDSDDETDSNSASEQCKCKVCNFEAKNIAGLKMHMNADHRLKCDKCSFKTTTKVLIKKHMKEFHVFT